MGTNEQATIHEMDELMVRRLGDVHEHLHAHEDPMVAAISTELQAIARELTGRLMAMAMASAALQDASKEIARLNRELEQVKAHNRNLQRSSTNRYRGRR